MKKSVKLWMVVLMAAMIFTMLACQSACSTEVISGDDSSVSGEVSDDNTAEDEDLDTDDEGTEGNDVSQDEGNGGTEDADNDDSKEDASVDDNSENDSDDVATESGSAASEEPDADTGNANAGEEEVSAGNASAPIGTPFEIHGKLKVDGTNIVDANGEPFQIAGVSTHGIAWFPEYVNKDAFLSIRDDWGANTIRLAMYTAENGGYCEGGDKNNLKTIVKNGVDYATDLGMYVIIDWHILHDLDPNKYKTDSIAFFDEMSKEYKDQDNVIYEICNEPNGGTSWSQVKSYALEVIPVIRANDPDAIIIVGTPNWCQYVDDAANDPITEYDNIVYAVHFYAETHRDDIRNRMTTAINKGIPVIISEFSICDASGNGTNNIEQANIWIDLLDQYNVGFVAWNLSNKAESSSIISSGCQKKSGWTYDELSESGKWLVGVLNEHSDQGAGLLNGQAPTVSGNGGSSNTTTDTSNNNNQGSNNSSDNGGNNQQAALPSGSGSGNNLYATVTASNTWESGGKQCTQLNVSIENKGSASVNGWTIEIDLAQAATIDQIWCAVGKVEGNKVIITPESFNGTIESGKTVSDIGLIISSSNAVSAVNVQVR